jgi:oligoendopeptidase F
MSKSIKATMSAVFTRIEKLKRNFLPEDFKITTWDAVQPYFEKLIAASVDTKEKLEEWLHNISELEAVISEDACWRQINMTCDTTNKNFEDAFTYFCMEIEPKMKPYFFELNKKLLASPFVNELDKNQYFPYLRSVKNATELYREENVQIQAELSLLAQQYGVISGRMTIEHEGKE